MVIKNNKKQIKSLTKKSLDNAFNQSKNGYDLFLKIYKLVYPNYDQIKSMSYNTQVNTETNLYITDLILKKSDKNEFDQIFELLMNVGFSTNDKLDSWIVKQTEYEI